MPPLAHPDAGGPIRVGSGAPPSRTGKATAVESSPAVAAVLNHSPGRAIFSAAAGTARREGRGVARRACLASVVFGKAFDAFRIPSAADPARLDVAIKFVPAAIGVAVRVSGINARCVCPALGAPPARGVLEKLKLVFSCVFHVLNLEWRPLVCPTTGSSNLTRGSAK